MAEAVIDRQRLHHVGNLSIFMIGLGFVVRANIAPRLQTDIYDKIDLANSAAMVGEALGVTFTGFALTLLFGSALVDLVGGLLGVAISAFGLSWKLNMLVLLLPALLLAWMVFRSTFPVTERVAAGVSYLEMFSELLKRPLFWVFWLCMYLTAAAELAPGQWVNISLSNVVGMQGILLLVYVSALMFVMRHFAGPIVARISSVGLMFVSCLAAGLGLYLLSLATSPLPAFAAATIWGIGVCYLWPTMLAITSERFPRGGAVAMGLMGFAGGMAIQFVLPQMGAIFDSARAEAAAENLATLSPQAMAEVVRYASTESFQAVAIVPILLLPVFGAIWIYDRGRGELLTTETHSDGTA